jgi:hypothetical protein
MMYHGSPQPENRMSIIEQVDETLKKAPPEVAQDVLDFLEFLEMRRQQKPAKVQSWDDLIGALSTSPAFAGDPVDIQRQLRAAAEV